MEIQYFLELIVPAIFPFFNELQKRFFVGGLSNIPSVSITYLSNLTGLHRNTISRGKKEFFERAKTAISNFKWNKTSDQNFIYDKSSDKTKK